MPNLHWFGLSITFHCQACQKQSVEQFVMSHTNENEDEIIREVQMQNIMCKRCGLPIVVGTQTAIKAVRGTPEQLKAAGFFVPSEYLRPPI